MPGVALAILGYLFTYWHTKQADGRKANIERINEQLRELYGPLLASVTATQSAYNAMVKSATVKTPFHAHQDDAATAEAFRSAVTADPQGPVAVTYRYWMKNVLQPLNEQAAEVIVKRIDLLEADAMSDVLLRFVAHVTTNRVVLRQWELGELDAHSAIPYPDELVGFIERQFAYMKRRQAQMLSVPLRLSRQRSKL